MVHREVFLVARYSQLWLIVLGPTLCVFQHPVYCSLLFVDDLSCYIWSAERILQLTILMLKKWSDLTVCGILKKKWSQMPGGRLYLPSLYASLQTTGLDTTSEEFSGQIVSTSTYWDQWVELVGVRTEQAKHALLFVPTSAVMVDKRIYL